MSSDANLVRRLREAAAAVDSAELPADLRSPGFVLAFSAGSPVRKDPARTPTSPNGDAPSSEPDKTLAQALGVQENGLDRIYDFVSEALDLIVPPRVLAQSRRAAMAEVALLVVAGRQGLGLEEWTKVEEVRRACEGRGVLDPTNFGKVISALDGHGVRVRGRGAGRELSINAAGFQRTGELIERLLAELD